MIVVNVPDPAINGNATGTMVEDFPSPSDLKNSIPKTISNPNIKITIEPATAKDFTSKPKILNMDSPKNKKSNINTPAMDVTLKALISPNFFFKEINMGMDPIMSIIAKIVSDTVKMAL